LECSNNMLTTLRGCPRTVASLSCGSNPLVVVHPRTRKRTLTEMAGIVVMDSGIRTVPGVTIPHELHAYLSDGDSLGICGVCGANYAAQGVIITIAGHNVPEWKCDRCI